MLFPRHPQIPNVLESIPERNRRLITEDERRQDRWEEAAMKEDETLP